MHIIHSLCSFVERKLTFFFCTLVNRKLFQRKIEMNYFAKLKLLFSFADKKNNNLLENIWHFTELEIISIYSSTKHKTKIFYIFQFQ